MTRYLKNLPWAGPAVALALLFATVDARPAAAQPVAPAAVTAATTSGPFCVTEAYDFGAAVAQWYDAWSNYEWTLPGGTEPEILRAAEQLDQATLKVAETGAKLLVCLAKLL